MSESSNTRVADHAAALAANSHLAPAITWLQTNTHLGRLGQIELQEAITKAVTNGTFLISFGGNSIP